MLYELVVGNVGSVYHGTQYSRAYSLYIEYATMSKNLIGRAGGETVTLLEDGEVIQEYLGEVSYAQIKRAIDKMDYLLEGPKVG